jgi:hypothetical protein
MDKKSKKISEKEFLRIYNKFKSEETADMFTDEEIIKACKYNIAKFSKKIPKTAEYYISFLDN